MGGLFLLILLAALGGWIAFEYWAQRDRRAPGGPPVSVVVEKGDSLRAIARKLERAGLAGPETFTVALAFRLGVARNLQPGTHHIQFGTPPVEILRALSRAPEIPTARLTFPEGWTNEQIAARLAARGAISDSERFLRLCSDPAFLKSAGVPFPSASSASSTLTIQGFLFPDTYEFTPPPNEAEAIRRMGSRFQSVIRELGLLPGMNSPHAFPLTYFETVTLASIIEREARDAAEMPLIASVYHNRLRANMRLDSCATVRYALGQWQAPLTLEDLKVESPYNTYLHKGLPPGPICNPGRAALEAAFRPAESDYLYYVYKGDGRHAFSCTLREHEQAVRKYKDAWKLPARVEGAE